MTVVLEAHDLCYRYPGNEGMILNGLNLEVEKGEAVAVVGLSGCGKSTLCYCLSGIIPNVYGGEINGQVKIIGKDAAAMRLPQIATMLGIVFQEPETQLFSSSVEDETAFGPENLCLDREEIGRRIKKTLKMVGMEDYRETNPGRLSGGQKQLIALASSLSLEPEILIMDEVMAQVDEEGKKLIKEAIAGLKAAGKTLVLVEHDMDNLNLADRVLLLKNGRLQEYTGVLK